MPYHKNNLRKEDLRMKKLIAFICILALLIPVTGCARLDTPTITQIGNYVSWEPVEEASSYEIYANGELYDTVTEPNYFFTDVTKDLTVQIMARGVKERIKSKMTEEFTISQNSGFKTEETFELTLASHEEFSVPASIKHLTVTGSAENTVIIIEERKTDLVVTLDNVTLSSKPGKSCIYQNGDKTGSAIIVEMVGTSTLKATNVNSVPEAPAKGSEKTGSNGYEGGHGIQYENIVFIGNGNIDLFGGNGGQGATGAAQKDGLFTLSQAGNGGDGGTGGSGFSCDGVVIKAGMTSKITVHGGKGGAAGAHGEISISIAGGITGGLGFVHDGAAGADGATHVCQSMVKISGSLHEE